METSVCRRKEFLADLLTGNGTWILCNNITRHGIWIPRDEDPPTATETRIPLDEVFALVLLGLEGIAVFRLDSLALALQVKRPRRSTVNLLRDIARPHVTKDTQTKLQDLAGTTIASITDSNISSRSTPIFHAIAAVSANFS
ncbi:unnamed protein product [Caenorhabditis nigoni]